MKKAKSSLQNTDGVGETLYGEHAYTSDQLMQMDGYNSDEDSKALSTPCFYWRVENRKCTFIFYENQEYTSNDPFSKIGQTPELFELIIVDPKDDQQKLWIITIPIDKITLIALKSDEHIYNEYEIPGNYNCKIELKSGHKISIKGDFQEKFPEYWYYNHSVSLLNA